MERLSTSQFDALHKWIAQGGILAVSGGADYALLRSPRLAALLPGLPLGMTRLDAGELQRAFSASLDVSRPSTSIGWARSVGACVCAPVRRRSIVERTLGLGRVLYLTFDVAGYPFDRWDGMRALWLDSLRLPPTEHNLWQRSRTGEPACGPDPRRGNGFSRVFHRAFCSSRSIWGCCSRLSRSPCAARSAAGSRRSASWAAPVLFAPAAWLLFGPAAFPRGATAATVALIEPFPDSSYARLGLDLGLYSNRSGALRLEYRGAEPVLYPSRQAQREGQRGGLGVRRGTTAASSSRWTATLRAARAGGRGRHRVSSRSLGARRDHGSAARPEQRQRAERWKTCGWCSTAMLTSSAPSPPVRGRAQVDPRDARHRGGRGILAARAASRPAGCRCRCWRRRRSCSSAGRRRWAKADIPAPATRC